MRDRDRLAALAARARQRGEPVAWFEELYREAGKGNAYIPWDDGRANPWLVDWMSRWNRPQDGQAVVVGCGFGDDAEALAAAGHATTAFDIAPTAIARCRERFPRSRVEYVRADAARLPHSWRRRFALVFECYTLQALPSSMRGEVAAALGDLVAPNGALLLVTRGREPGQEAAGPPWPLSREELQPFSDRGLVLQRFEDFMDRHQPGVRRFRGLWRRPAP